MFGELPCACTNTPWHLSAFYVPRSHKALRVFDTLCPVPARGYGVVGHSETRANGELTLRARVGTVRPDSTASVELWKGHSLARQYSHVYRSRRNALQLQALSVGYGDLAPRRVSIFCLMENTVSIHLFLDSRAGMPWTRSVYTPGCHEMWLKVNSRQYQYIASAGPGDGDEVTRVPPCPSSN